MKKASLSSMVLTLLLHNLACKGSMSDANLKLSLLHALPSMAGDNGCISLIMKLITSLASKPSTAPLRLTLLAKLWREESRCYPLLQKTLLEPTPSTSATEYQITQTAVIRDIVSTHAMLGPPAKCVKRPQSVQWSGGDLHTLQGVGHRHEDHGEGARPRVWEGQEAHGQCAVHQASGFGPNIQIVRARVYQLLV